MRLTLSASLIAAAVSVTVGTPAHAFPSLEVPKGFAAFSYSHLNPPELQYSCVGSGNDEEDKHGERLAKGSAAEQLIAARALWWGHSRRNAAAVVKYLAGPPPRGEGYRTLQRLVEESLRPESILRELTRGDYLWGTWLAFLRPHPDLVPALLVGLKAQPDHRSETILALGNSGDPRVRDPLLAILKGKEDVSAGFAAMAFGYLGDESVEPALIEALTAGSSWLQVQASNALAEMGSVKALPALEKIANKKGSTGALDVRGCAMRAVVRIERRTRPADDQRGDAKPLAELRGHAGHVWTFAFSPDGKALASVGDDRTVRIWNPATATATATYTGHARQMTELAFVGRERVATAGWGDDGSIKILDIQTGKLIVSLPVAEGGVSTMAVSPDGKRIAVPSSGEPPVVQLWDATTGKVVAPLPGSGRVLAFSPDGMRLATTTSEEREDIQIWDMSTRKVVFTLRGQTDFYTCAAFSPDGNTLVSGGDWHVHLWDLTTGKQKAQYRGDGPITGVAFHPNGKSVASGEQDGTVRLRTIADGKVTATMRGTGHVEFRPDGKQLASGSEDGTTILLWDLPRKDQRKP